MRMTDDAQQQDADRKDRRTQKWLEHCAACHDELLAAAQDMRDALNALGQQTPTFDAIIAKSETKS